MKQIPAAESQHSGGEEVFVFPLSFAQERLWFMDQLLPGNRLFNLNTALRLRTALEVDALERSINEIVRRHETLRTRFTVIDFQPVQVVVPSLRLKVPLVDLSGLPPAERECEATRLANEEAHRPFDLTKSPLLRVSLLRLGREDHVLLVTMHHIVSDGWSMGIFWNELSAIWSAFARGRPSPLPELPLQYADFALWQREWLQGAVLEEQLLFWKKNLAGAPVTELPHDYVRPSVQSFSGATHVFTLPNEVSAGLEQLCKREGATLFMILLAAFQTLLHRYTGEEDIVVGSYIAGRNRAEVEGLIGFFLNSLVMRVDTSGGPTFREMIARVRAGTLKAYAHQDMPFAKLVEKLQPERDLSRNPLFQVMFQLLNVPTLSRFQSGAKPELLSTQQRTAVFDLSCMLSQTPDGLTGHFEYNTDLFRPETIERLANHYQRLLASAVAAPDTQISRLEFLSAGERRRLLVDWSRGSTTHSAHTSVVNLFEAQAARRADKAALIFGKESVTFGELNRRANRLARFLKKLGVGRESVIAICLERSLDVVALLGIFKAGAAYLPLDPAYPEERLLSMLRDSGAAMVLTRKEFRPLLKRYSGNIVDLGEECDAIDAQDDTNLNDLPSAPNDLAYAIFTSGSTGEPKGVAVEHRQLLNRFTWMWARYPFVKGEVGCLTTSLSFVDSIWEFFGPLLQGVPSVIIPDATVKDPLALVRSLASNRVTRIWLVPSLLRAVLAGCPDLGNRLPALKFWVSSGEVLTGDIVEEFRRALPHAELFNLYGTSEVWDVTWFDTRETNGHRVSIGRPIDNMEVYVLDRQMQPVPPGVTGELYVSGTGLARGYIKQPDLTEAAFIPSPWQSGARLYKTGDLAAWLPDGNLDYIGRIDSQVKIRGFRIEPSEIEMLIAQIPGVEQAIVALQKNDMEDARLVAYFASTGVAPNAATIRVSLRQKLPEFMIPADFVRVRQFLLTPSGKIDRRNLPNLGDIEPEIAEGYTAPRNSLEQKIADIWKEVLRREKVGINDNFFDLGGHSLLIFKVHGKLQRLGKKHITITDLFRYPTVTSLAQFCAAGDIHKSVRQKRNAATRA